MESEKRVASYVVQNQECPAPQRARIGEAIHLAKRRSSASQAPELRVLGCNFKPVSRDAFTL